MPETINAVPGILILELFEFTLLIIVFEDIFV